MMITLRWLALLTTSATLISCSSLFTESPTLPPATFTPTATPSATVTSLPSFTSTPINTDACIEYTRASERDGWDCINQSYGFTVHFPSTADAPRPLNDTVIVWLENSPANPRVERIVSIAVGEAAESCIVVALETIQIGEQTFFVNHGFEPSGAVYEWKSYGVTNESKSVCFVFMFSFQTREQDDPQFPPEEDQGLEDIEAILATFRWIDP